MKTKTKLIIIILLLVILGILSTGILFNQNQDQNQNQDLDSNSIKVGDAEFALPDGFTEGKSNSKGDVNITKGNDTIFLTELEAKNINESMQAYQDYCAKNEHELSMSTLTMGDTVVYKSTDVNSNTNHYWFEKDGKGYSIYTWKPVEDIDEITNSLITSMK